MIDELVIFLVGGAALGFLSGLYYADSSNRRSEADFTVRQTLAQVERLRGDVERVLNQIKS
jgi:hypothetical protein